MRATRQPAVPTTSAATLPAEHESPSAGAPTRHQTPSAGPRSRREPPPAPLVLGRYRLLARLGTGAFGTVWRGHDERLDRDVAVKILPRERIVGGRFEREARAAARLAHPGIVTLHEAAVDDDGAYLVSELVLGSTMDALLDAGRLSDHDIVEIGIVLCDALAHAHAHGVVHRDVKPSNILVPEAPPSDAQLARLTDFGVARVAGGDALTLTGDVLGTLAYMAPEQAEGLEVGPEADLYALALVIYEALTGINPVATTAAAPRGRRLGMHLPPLRRRRRDLPRELATGVDQALRPRPRERGTIGELRHCLVLARDLVGDDAVPAWTNSGDEPAPAWTGGDAGPAADAVARPPGRPAAREAWPDRGLGAAAAAGLAAWLAATVLHPSPLPPAPAALLAAAVVLALPRLGWAALILALAGAAAAQSLPGVALVLVIGGALPVELLPAGPTAWPLAAAAPALGLIGLAGAWPACAGRAATAWRRAVLGALGWFWLLLASALSDRVLYLPRLPGMAGAAAVPDAGATAWASLPATVTHVLGPIVTSGALAPAAVWAAAAVVAPWLVGGRAPALDIVRVVVWAALVVAATTTAVAAVHGSDQIGAAPTAVVGALACGAVALAPPAVAAWRRALHSPRSAARVP
ncbi:MAG: serine/threonine-protein kinase [Solirubrobacteraceae bacterium]